MQKFSQPLRRFLQLSLSHNHLPIPGAYSAIKDDVLSEIQGLRDNGTIKTERIIVGKQVHEQSRFWFYNVEDTTSDRVNIRGVCKN